jgi:hypothetical protein
MHAVLHRGYTKVRKKLISRPDGTWSNQLGQVYVVDIIYSPD